MSALDLSAHALNISTSKQKYSFPKNDRFNQRDSKPICDTFYDIPTTKTRRTTTLGLGEKDIGLNTKLFSPGAGTYDLGDTFDAKRQKYRAISFGYGREKMELAGPLGHVKYHSKLPAPGTYNNQLSRDTRAPSLRSRLPDHQFEKSVLNPGPGTYNNDTMGTRNYYVTSKYRNFTNGKMSQVSRLDPISNRSSTVGPAVYNAVDILNPVGRYNLSKHSNAGSCVFSKSSRPGMAQKQKAFIPGPGHYASFSSFG